MRSRTILGWTILVIAAALSACDAWPTQVINKSPAAISFRWHHKQHQEWSAPLMLQPGQHVRLARAHCVADFTGISVTDGPKTYTVPDQQMADYRRICSRSLIDHLTTMGDCDITYLGQGRIAVSRVQ